MQQCLPFAVLKLIYSENCFAKEYLELQQCLPFAVLKPNNDAQYNAITCVATVLTVCGIETFFKQMFKTFVDSNVATVLTVCGIETISYSTNKHESLS